MVESDQVDQENPWAEHHKQLHEWARYFDQHPKQESHLIHQFQLVTLYARWLEKELGRWQLDSDLWQSIAMADSAKRVTWWSRLKRIFKATE